jgi:hypothetical protein
MEGAAIVEDVLKDDSTCDINLVICVSAQSYDMQFFLYRVHVQRQYMSAETNNDDSESRVYDQVITGILYDARL